MNVSPTNSKQSGEGEFISQRNNSLLANRLAQAGGRRIPEIVLERDYCLAWFLAGLAERDLRQSLAFKSGAALRRCYYGDYRVPGENLRKRGYARTWRRQKCTRER